MRQAGSSAPEQQYQVAALRMQLLVAMAASDGRVLPVEVDRIARTIDDARLDPESTERLEQLLKILLDAPPTLDQVVERIVEQAPKRAVAERLVGELVYVARIDDRLEDEEEELLRLVCGALGIEPGTIHRDRMRRPLDAGERAQLAELLASVGPA